MALKISPAQESRTRVSQEQSKVRMAQTSEFHLFDAPSNVFSRSLRLSLCAGSGLARQLGEEEEQSLVQDPRGVDGRLSGRETPA